MTYNDVMKYLKRGWSIRDCCAISPDRSQHLRIPEAVFYKFVHKRITKFCPFDTSYRLSHFAALAIEKDRLRKLINPES